MRKGCVGEMYNSNIGKAATTNMLWFNITLAAIWHFSFVIYNNIQNKGKYQIIPRIKLNHNLYVKLRRKLRLLSCVHTEAKTQLE